MRTRLRPLHIDGNRFLWRAEVCCVRDRGDGHRCVRVRLWGDARSSRALWAGRVALPWPVCGEADVRAIVEYALRRGWVPTGQGGTVVVSERAKTPVVSYLPAARPRAERIIRASAIGT